MILYLDTSALNKRYIAEDGRETVFAALNAALLTTTSAITYAEARAAFARRWRAGDLDEEELTRFVITIGNDREALIRQNVTNAISRHAGELAQTHALRGYDSVQLACALTLAERFDDLTFLAFDNRLIQAAREAGLTIYGDTTIARHERDG